MTQSEFTKRRDELYMQEARIQQELQIMKYEYIKSNKQMKEGQRVMYPTTTYTSDGVVKATETATFTGNCEISSNGSIMYELLPDDGGGVIYLEANLFEVVK